MLCALRAAELTFGRRRAAEAVTAGALLPGKVDESSAHDGAASAPGWRGAEAGK